MFRQTAFGIALSMLVFASGLTSAPVSSHSSTNKPTHNKPLSNPSNQVVASNTAFNTTALEKSVFDKVNRYRVSHGLPKLSIDTSITRQARIHSQNMANGKVPFSHHGFRQRVTILPIIYKSAGENVAFNQGYNDPASQAVIGWLNSPGHLKNIQGKYNLTGIGVAANQQGEVYLTQIFLRTN